MPGFYIEKRAVNMLSGSTSVLVVDNDARILYMLQRTLELEGYRVLKAINGETAIGVFDETTPDLVLLDIMMPDMDGYSVCQRIREFSQVPIIMVTAKVNDEDKVHGLDVGADDYITKPFSHIELVARVQAVLRRVQGLPVASEERPFVSGKLLVDFTGNEVRLDGKPVKLTSTEAKLLYLLIRNEGRLVTHENLLTKVWGETYVDARDLLRVHIQHLRQKLGDNIELPSIIVTEHGMGYKFVRPADR